uniref:Uncharacterized protein n=1 Tax=Plectus sambesii TaxID=2011161 RepID=A0A914XCD7_9BILA
MARGADDCVLEEQAPSARPARSAVVSPAAHSFCLSARRSPTAHRSPSIGLRQSSGLLRRADPQAMIINRISLKPLAKTLHRLLAICGCETAHVLHLTTLSIAPNRLIATMHVTADTRKLHSLPPPISSTTVFVPLRIIAARPSCFTFVTGQLAIVRCWEVC